MNLIIGSHRLRSLPDCYAIAYSQNTKSGEVAWRDRWYPTTLQRAFELLFEQEFKARSVDCTELHEAIETARTLHGELCAVGQLPGSSRTA